MFLHAPAEGFSRLAKQVKLVASGFRNTENSRRRMRFHCAQRGPASDSPPRNRPAKAMADPKPVTTHPAQPGRSPPQAQIPTIPGD